MGLNESDSRLQGVRGYNNSPRAATERCIEAACHAHGFPPEGSDRLHVPHAVLRPENLGDHVNHPFKQSEEHIERICLSRDIKPQMFSRFIHQVDPQPPAGSRQQKEARVPPLSVTPRAHGPRAQPLWSRRGEERDATPGTSTRHFLIKISVFPGRVRIGVELELVEFEPADGSGRLAGEPAQRGVLPAARVSGAARVWSGLSLWIHGNPLYTAMPSWPPRKSPCRRAHVVSYASFMVVVGTQSSTPCLPRLKKAGCGSVTQIICEGALVRCVLALTQTPTRRGWSRGELRDDCVSGLV
ncbi:unnamed protein product [Pleuronectes platessa]|uniref:Uncharacterized protein n=1 Tax=Pleuronectes platessa TaxID=8262 RepID=A0A9N7V927_PLEPL|nr:unnamed protein product [Pleuronectes platessa]